MLPKLGRTGSSSRVFIGLCPLPAGPGAPLAATLSGGPIGPLYRLPVALLPPVAGLLGSLAGGLGPEVSGPVVGCFSQKQLSYWAACTSDPWVVSIQTRGYELQFRRRPLAFGRIRMTVVSDPAKALALAQELSVLLAKGAIEPVDPLLQPGGFYSAYFLVTKKVGGFRPVLDLRGLNRFLKVLPFHMLTTADTLRVVTQGEGFATVDLRDAYFHLPIASHHRRFLRFAFQGQHYQFRVLPFGLSLSPRVFTRVVAAALAPLQAQGVKVLPCLDDWLVAIPASSGPGYGAPLVSRSPVGPESEHREELSGRFPTGHLPGDRPRLGRHEGLPDTSSCGRHFPPSSHLQAGQDGA